MNKNNIYVTEPTLPDFDDVIISLRKIWKSKWITNGGQFHQTLEKELEDYLGVNNICLFANGTLALMVAIQALELKGEIITTPYSFVATANAIHWNGIKPVFVDIEESGYNIDAGKIEEAITSQTSAILPVHVYGIPANSKEIQKIADAHNLKVIYDAAHAFGVKKDKQSILNFGDLSVLSFHATKVFNTFEGGAIICHDGGLKEKIDQLKNFGFESGTSIIAPGINAKMNEFQAAIGLLQLDTIEREIQNRVHISNIYRKELSKIDGISFVKIPENLEYNYSYFPISIAKEKYGQSRDDLYFHLKKQKILARRYFYPLISEFLPYQSLKSSDRSNLAKAHDAAESVLCLPMHGNLELETIDFISRQILSFKNKKNIL